MEDGGDLLSLVCGLAIGTFIHLFTLTLVIFQHTSTHNSHVKYIEQISFLDQSSDYVTVDKYLSLSVVSAINIIYLGSSKSTYKVAVLSALYALNLSLIFIANPSISNPGPKDFNVIYNNVHGQINTSPFLKDKSSMRCGCFKQ